MGTTGDTFNLLLPSNVADVFGIDLDKDDTDSQEAYKIAHVHNTEFGEVLDNEIEVDFRNFSLARRTWVIHAKTFLMIAPFAAIISRGISSFASVMGMLLLIMLTNAIYESRDHRTKLLTTTKLDSSWSWVKEILSSEEHFGSIVDVSVSEFYNRLEYLLHYEKTRKELEKIAGDLMGTPYEQEALTELENDSRIHQEVTLWFQNLRQRSNEIKSPHNQVKALEDLDKFRYRKLITDGEWERLIAGQLTSSGKLN